MPSERVAVKYRVAILVAAVALLAGGPVGAQKPKPQPRAAALPCPDCNRPKEFWFGFGELMIAQAVPLSINNILRDAEWAKITPRRGRPTSKTRGSGTTTSS
jgi:hypothetical protein